MAFAEFDAAAHIAKQVRANDQITNEHYKLFLQEMLLAIHRRHFLSCQNTLPEKHRYDTP